MQELKTGYAKCEPCNYTDLAETRQTEQVEPNSVIGAGFSVLWEMICLRRRVVTALDEMVHEIS